MLLTEVVAEEGGCDVGEARKMMRLERTAKKKNRTTVEEVLANFIKIGAKIMYKLQILYNLLYSVNLDMSGIP